MLRLASRTKKSTTSTCLGWYIFLYDFTPLHFTTTATRVVDPPHQCLFFGGVTQTHLDTHSLSLQV